MTAGDWIGAILGWGLLALWFGTIIYIFVRAIVYHVKKNFFLPRERRGFDVLPPH